MNFYKCAECLSVVMEIVPGEPAEAKTFQELHANSTDASGEKHVPAISQDGDKVSKGGRDRTSNVGRALYYVDFCGDKTGRMPEKALSRRKTRSRILLIPWR